jgi:hypothetical protein
MVVDIFIYVLVDIFMIMKPEIFLGILFQSRDLMHIAHLETMSFAQHNALDTFYKEIIESVDELTETYFGIIDGRVPLVIPESRLVNADFYLRGLRKTIYENRDSLGMENTEIQNIIDEILGLIAQTLYRLSLS